MRPLARALAAASALAAAWLAAPAPAAACGDSPALAVGERLEFGLSWLGIPAGRASLAVESRAEAGGREALRLVARARSNKVLDVFYKVRVYAESVFDCAGRFSHRFVHQAEEGRRRRYRVYTFDLASHEVRREQLGEEALAFPLPRPVQDPFTTLYEIRARSLEIGRSVFMETFEGKRLWDLEVQVLRRERVRVPAGTFDTIVVKPLLRFEGVFVQKGDVLVWLTDDERRMPVRMESEVRIGSVAADLRSFARPGD